MAEHHTSWSSAWTLLKWGKWALAVFALNQIGALIDTLFFLAVGVLAVAVIADRIRTRRLLRRWDEHCQEVADQWARAQTTPPETTALPEPEQSRWAA